jgi:hypothetical protein
LAPADVRLDVPGGFLGANTLNLQQTRVRGGVALGTLVREMAAERTALARTFVAARCIAVRGIPFDVDCRQLVL